MTKNIRDFDRNPRYFKRNLWLLPKSYRYWPILLRFWPKSLRFTPKPSRFWPEPWDLNQSLRDFVQWGFEKIFKILTQQFEILTNNSEIFTKTFEILTGHFEILFKNLWDYYRNSPIPVGNLFFNEQTFQKRPNNYILHRNFGAISNIIWCFDISCIPWATKKLNFT